MRTKPKLKLRRHDLYMGRPLKSAEGETPDNGFHPELPPEPMLKDAEIEDDNYRRGLSNGEGDISVIVEAGDELGQIKVSLQFEGPKGQYNACLTEQGKLLNDALQWLDDIYKPFEGEFEMDVVSNPCPHGSSSLIRIVDREVERRVEPLGPQVRDRVERKTDRTR